MAKKKKGVQRPKGGSSDDDETQFVVEVIKAAKVEDGKWQFLVKWANYDSSDDTWEPIENLTNCSRLLKSFWRDVGEDDNDYYEGYTVKATPSWIKREKQRFANTQKKREVESSSEDDEPQASSSTVRIKTEPPPKSKGKGKAVAKAAPKKPGRPSKAKSRSVEISDDGDDSDDTPLLTSRQKSKKRVVLESDNESDDDVPLAKQTSKPRPKITTPARPKTHPSADPASSDSAGSLFSEKEESSANVATVSTPTTPATPATTKRVTIPAKRPSTDDMAQGQRKRQIVEMPMAITGTAGNATKARLAQRMPQIPQQPSASQALAKQPLDLSKLSFKKKNATTAPSPTISNSPVNPTTTVPPLPRRSASASSPIVPLQRTPTFESHVPSAVAPAAEQRRATMPLPRLTTLRQRAEAEKFLANVMPDAMSSSMQEDVVVDMPPPPVPARTAPKITALPRIQKKWKWTGDLFMDVSRSKAERVCGVLLHDATDALPNGLRFSICLTGDSIRLSAFRDLASLPLILSASTRVQQFAKIGPSEENESDALKALATYMKKRSLFCVTHLYMDNTSVALLVVYPTGHAIPTKVLHAPTPPDTEVTALEAALVPWELTADEFRKYNWKARSPAEECALDPALVSALDKDGRHIVKHRRLYQALHIIQFPLAMYTYVTQTPRPYCIWTGPADITIENPGYETSLLKEILSQSKASDVGHTKAVRVIFVHVGGIASLHFIGSLAERRKNHNMRFITYGTHPSVPRERWGVREIYPLGGIVTFTPSAIIEGHFKLFQLIKDIAAHPTWECYVLPSVVAMVAKLTCQGQHPLRVYDEKEFVYEDLLTLIEEGKLALLQAPPVARDSLSKGDPRLLWTRWTLRLPTMNARQILEECLTIAKEEFAKTSPNDLPRAIEEEICRDMLRMQSQPAIMDSYRRFVVVRGSSDTLLARDMKGFECTRLSAFEWKDDFYDASTR